MRKAQLRVVVKELVGRGNGCHPQVSRLVAFLGIEADDARRRNAKVSHMPPRDMGAYELGLGRGSGNAGTGQRIYVIPMIVAAKDIVGVPYLLGAQKRRNATPGRRRQKRVKVEDQPPHLDNIAQLPQPPKGNGARSQPYRVNVPNEIDSCLHITRRVLER